MFKKVTLEISLKPFKKTDDAYIKKVCKGVFEQWHALLKNREVISIMLWTADGSEILDYNKNLEDTFEWCRFIGTANKSDLPEGMDIATSLYSYRQDYMKNPPIMTYGILKKIVQTFKDEGKKAFPNATIRVGETFDIGPEFAISDFKYKRHPEISSGAKIDHLGFVDSTALLNADDRSYAAYPNGIPQDTKFGTFFGKQSKIFLEDMGFNYIWLSNGLGFSADPWTDTGKIFNGKEFLPQNLEKTKEKVFEFWKLFSSECKGFPIETRGTNQTVGIDYATDGVPIYDIYNSGIDITPPPNSPWAAINDNYGLEIMGHMTRICNLPKNEFMFRYYLHDPWWCNSPWYDRYDSAPTDIYLPMAISRIDENGKPQSAEICNFLSIDNSFGNMPDSCVNEPLPHILKAEKDIADEVAPLVLVYPMREFSTSKEVDMLYEMYYGDKFVCDAINKSLPLCTVVSTDIFAVNDLSIYKGRVLISPFPTGETLTKLRQFAKSGGNVIIYASKDKLDSIKNENFSFVDITESGFKLVEKLSDFGYYINHNIKTKGSKPPTMAITRSNGAFVFSVYNSNTTTDTALKFPLGAPILSGGEVEIKNDTAFYRFSRSEHKECRIFVKQKSGIISVHEAAPVNAKYRRRIIIDGLEDATVCFFPENYCKNSCDFLTNQDYDTPPDYDNNFEIINDDKFGTYYKSEHVTGYRAFLMPFPDKMK